MALSITSGTSHLIIPKRIVLTTILIAVGTMLGMYLSEHMRASRTQAILKSKNASIKEKNDLLSNEKDAYGDMLKQLEGHMTEWASEGGVPEEFLSKHKQFHETATSLMSQLQSVHDLLVEKEYELIDKEALLEYQEQQLMDSEELEDRMVKYINQMAEKLLQLKQPLPDGLKEEPFFSVTYVEESPEAPAASVKTKDSPQIKKLQESLNAVMENKAKAGDEKGPEEGRRLRVAKE